MSRPSATCMISRLFCMADVSLSSAAAPAIVRLGCKSLRRGCPGIQQDPATSLGSQADRPMFIRHGEVKPQAAGGFAGWKTVSREKVLSFAEVPAKLLLRALQPSTIALCTRGEMR